MVQQACLLTFPLCQLLVLLLCVSADELMGQTTIDFNDSVFVSDLDLYVTSVISNDSMTSTTAVQLLPHSSQSTVGGRDDVTTHSNAQSGGEPANVSTPLIHERRRTNATRRVVKRRRKLTASHAKLTLSPAVAKLSSGDAGNQKDMWQYHAQEPEIGSSRSGGSEGDREPVNLQAVVYVIIIAIGLVVMYTAVKVVDKVCCDRTPSAASKKEAAPSRRSVSHVGDTVFSRLASLSAQGNGLAAKCRKMSAAAMSCMDSAGQVEVNEQKAPISDRGGQVTAEQTLLAVANSCKPSNPDVGMSVAEENVADKDSTATTRHELFQQRSYGSSKAVLVFRASQESNTAVDDGLHELFKRKSLTSSVTGEPASCYTGQPTSGDTASASGYGASVSDDIGMSAICSSIEGHRLRLKIDNNDSTPSSHIKEEDCEDFEKTFSEVQHVRIQAEREQSVMDCLPLSVDDSDVTPRHTSRPPSAATSPIVCTPRVLFVGEYQAPSVDRSSPQVVLVEELLDLAPSPALAPTSALKPRPKSSSSVPTTKVTKNENTLMSESGGLSGSEHDGRAVHAPHRAQSAYCSNSHRKAAAHVTLEASNLTKPSETLRMPLSLPGLDALRLTSAPEQSFNKRNQSPITTCTPFLASRGDKKAQVAHSATEDGSMQAAASRISAVAKFSRQMALGSSQASSYTTDEDDIRWVLRSPDLKVKWNPDAILTDTSTSLSQTPTTASSLLPSPHYRPWSPQRKRRKQQLREHVTRYMLRTDLASPDDGVCKMGPTLSASQTSDMLTDYLACAMSHLPVHEHTDSSSSSDH